MFTHCHIAMTDWDTDWDTIVQHVEMSADTKGQSKGDLKSMFIQKMKRHPQLYGIYTNHVKSLCMF